MWLDEKAGEGEEVRERGTNVKEEEELDGFHQTSSDDSI